MKAQTTWQTLSLIAAIAAISTIGSFSLAFASQAQTQHNCIHCLKSNNNCCPGMDKAQAEGDKATHNCKHCVEQKRACCPHED